MTRAATLRREGRDVDARAISLFGLGLIGFLGLALIALHILFGHAPSPRPFGANTGLLHSSRVVLETDPGAGSAAYEAKERSLLATYGWVDPGAGIARIPIADALRIVAQQGIADWTGPKVAAEAGCAPHGEVPRAPAPAPCLGQPGGPVP